MDVSMVKLSVEQALLRADAHMRKGEAESAKALYDTVLVAYPKNTRAQEGLEKLNAVTHEKEDIKTPSKQQFDALIASYNLGCFPELIEHAEQLISEYPSSFLLWNILAAGRKALGQLAEAERGFRRATELNPSYADAHNNMGVTLRAQGKLDEAMTAYHRALEINPAFADTHYNMGITLREQGKLDEAMTAYHRALEINPAYAEALNNMGITLRAQGKLAEAIAAYHRALGINPAYAEALNNMGITLRAQGKLDEAMTAYHRALEINPAYAEAHNNMGVVLQEQGKLAEAITAYHRALEIKPAYAEAHNNMGNTLRAQGKLAEAMTAYHRALEIKPAYAEALNNMGNALRAQGKLAEAIAAYHRALEINPAFAEAYNNMGVTLKEQGKLAEAISAYHRALEINPAYADALNNMGNALKAQGKLAEAMTAYHRALEINPAFAEAYNNMGNALQEQGKLTEAMTAYHRALEINPAFAEAHYNMGVVLQEQGKLDEAMTAYHRALEIKPDCDGLRGMIAHMRGHLCDWKFHTAHLETLHTAIAAGVYVTPTFPLLALIDAPSLHRQVAEIHMQKKGPRARLPLPRVPARPNTKIHIAYLSADFHSHATMYRLAELFEQHDRNRFELTAISFGPDSQDAIRQRVSAAFDRFLDVRTLSHTQVAQQCRDLRVDVAIDLMGFTMNSRLGILAERCAPIQINWHGYPGTMAAPFIDYIVADRTLITEEDREYYTEKVIWLPDITSTNDSRKPISNKVITRAECGLPELGFVFCCFNANYKILPETFGVWMRILKRVPGSVLWLVEHNETARKNLQAEAVARGVDAERLVFAKRMPLAEHLARHRVADLFIDTWPYNAHTTASDALWVGLPVLTRSGQSFASRVAASALKAIGLPELITRSDQDYENLAVALAQDPPRLAALRTRLEENCLTHPLFDCERFTRNLESAYQQVMERYWAGAEPEHFVVEDVSERADHNHKNTPSPAPPLSPSVALPAGQ